MKSNVTTQHYLSLDFAAHRFDFSCKAEQMEIAWNKEFSYPQSKISLRWYDQNLYLIVAPYGIMKIGDSGLTEMNRFHDSMYSLYPSYNSSPVLVSDNGNLYRWNPSSDLELARNGKLAGNHLTPTGLPGNSILLLKDRGTLLKFIPGIGQWTIKCFDSATKKELWSQNKFLYHILPSQDGLFMVVGDEGRSIQHTNRDTGKTIWEIRLDSSISSLVGLVDDKLWLVDNEGSIIGIEISTARRSPGLKLPFAKNPQGIIDENGRLIVCNGVSLTIVDLLTQHSPEIILQKRIEIEGKYSCSTVLGNMVLQTKDDCIVFSDYYNRVFLLPLLKDRPGRFLWEAPDMIHGMGIAVNQLMVLHRSTLTALKVVLSPV